MSKRLITVIEAAKHGCLDCAEVCRSTGITRGDELINGRYLRGKACPHSVCPYAVEMDRYDTYDKYIKKQNEIWGPLIGKIAFS